MFALMCFGWVACSKIEPVWEVSAIDPNQRLSNVCFTDALNGFAVGGVRFSNDLIYRTQDGGTTWDSFPSPTSEKIVFEAEFRNANLGLLGSLDGRILRTEDGGNSWTTYQNFNWWAVNGITFVNDSLVLAASGDYYKKGQILRSTDAGKNWSVIDTFDFELRDIVFVNETHGFACGYGALMETLDAGLTWELTGEKNEFFTSICFPSPFVGYMVGRTGSILKTIDGGKSWDWQRNGNNPIPPRFHFNEVAFLTNEIGYIVGDKGVIWKTENGGHSWKHFERDTKADLFGIDIIRNGEAWVAGDKGTLIRFKE
jgi:photosystem II stability/assembly factor-like uncharacterized protein